MGEGGRNISWCLFLSLCLVDALGESRMGADQIALAVVVHVMAALIRWEAFLAPFYLTTTIFLLLFSIVVSVGGSDVFELVVVVVMMFVVWLSFVVSGVVVLYVVSCS